MEWRNFQEAVLVAAREAGCSDAEAYLVEENKKELTYRENRVEEAVLAHAASLCLRVLYEGSIGNASTEEPHDAEELVRLAVQNARYNENEDSAYFLPPQIYPPMDIPADPLKALRTDERITHVQSLEKALLSRDSRIEKVAQIGLSTLQVESCLRNSRGLEARNSRSTSYQLAGVISKEGEERKNYYGFRAGPHAGDTPGLVEETVQEAVERLGAKPIPTGDYAVVIAGRAMADLLECFLSTINGKAVQEGRSAWKDALGQEVVSPLLTLVDDPFLPDYPIAFDGEGSPSQLTTVIEKGRLLHFLHNLATAEKAGVETTANARRLGNGDVTVGHSNLYFQVGTTKEEDLLRKSPRVFLVKELAGLHSGIQPLSGDYSLLAGGLLYEEGQLKQKVNQVTIAGNFFRQMKEVEAVGDRLEYSMGLSHFVGSPALYFPKMKVAGEKEER